MTTPRHLFPDLTRHRRQHHEETHQTTGLPALSQANGQWAKRIDGKNRYFGPWSDPDTAPARYRGQRASPAKIARSAKSAKPHRDYPLCAHASGQWAKRLLGEVHYFGAWSDPDAALEKYLKEKDDLLRGREPANGDRLTLRGLANRLLTSKRRLVDSGETTARTLRDYEQACTQVLKSLGASRIVATLRPGDFERLRAKLAERYGPIALGNAITRVRVMFKCAFDSELFSPA